MSVFEAMKSLLDAYKLDADDKKERGKQFVTLSTDEAGILGNDAEMKKKAYGGFYESIPIGGVVLVGASLVVRILSAYGGHQPFLPSVEDYITNFGLICPAVIVTQQYFGAREKYEAMKEVAQHILETKKRPVSIPMLLPDLEPKDPRRLTTDKFEKPAHWEIPPP